MAATSQDIKSKLSGHEDFDEAEHKLAINYILGWLWCYDQNYLFPLLYGVKSDPELELWCEKLHDSNLLPASPSTPSGSSILSPSDVTLSNLASNIHSLTTTIEKHYSNKASKKKKFESLEQFVQDFILIALSRTLDVTATALSDSFAELLDCPSTARAQASLNHKLHQKGCEVNVPLPMVSFLLTGDWIVRHSDNPDKLSFMFLGPNQSGKLYTSKNKDQLRVHFQQLFSKELSKENIEALISCSFLAIEGFHDLEPQVFTICHFLG